MVQKENSKEKVDELALKLFKQIGLKDDEIESTIDLVKFIESTPKSNQQTEVITKPTKEITEAQQIKELEEIIEEQRKKIIKYENKIGPNLILMIKNYLDKLNSANNEIKEKQDKIIMLEKEMYYLKESFRKLKSIWTLPDT